MQSNPTQNTPPKATNVQNTPVPPAPRSPVDAREVDRGRLAFARTLERAVQSDAQASDRSESYSTRSVDDRPERDSQNESDRQSDKDDTQQNEVFLGTEIAVPVRNPFPGLVNALNPFVTAAQPLLSQEQIATLQRMAAAIAEVTKAGVDAKMTVQFGAMNGIADGAILGRDPRGGLTIHLVGAPPHMTPANAQTLRADLMQRLLKRKLNVSEVDFIESRTLTERAVKQASMPG